MGTSDGLDSVTSFILENQHILQRHAINAAPAPVEYYDSLTASLKRMAKEAGTKGPPRTDSGAEEMEWIGSLSEVA